jgi:pilus assembly protein CpaF
VGRRVDEASPICDARLADGSRVNVIAPPLAIDGPALTIRKFKKDKLTLEQLVRFGTISPEGADVLKIIGRCRANTLISGGTGSGKTTLLNCLTRYIDNDERIVTCEDAAELQLQQPHVVRLETRPPNLEGEGRSPCAIWSAIVCVCGLNASSSARCADRKRSTCCRP